MARVDVTREGELLSSIGLSGPGRRWLIGRSAEAHIVINHPLVSRQHAAITEEDGAYYLTDLGSAHGTRVMGQLIVPNQPFRLFDGLKITVGGATRELIPRGTVAALTAVAAQAARAQADAARRAAEAEDEDEDEDEAPQSRGNKVPSEAHLIGAALLSGGLASSAAAELAAQEAEDEVLRAMFPMQLGKAPTDANATSLDTQHAAFARKMEHGPCGAGVSIGTKGKKGGGLKMAPKLGATLGTGLNVSAASPTLVALQKSRAEAEEAQAAASARTKMNSCASSGGSSGSMLPPPPRRPACALAPSRPTPDALASERNSMSDASSDEDDVGPPLPPGFSTGGEGEKSEKADEDNSENEVGPPLPPGLMEIEGHESIPSNERHGEESDGSDCEIGPSLPLGFGEPAGAATKTPGIRSDPGAAESADEVITFGPQMLPDVFPGTSVVAARAEDETDIETSFGPQLPAGMAAAQPPPSSYAAEGPGTTSYDPNDLSQQIFDSDAVAARSLARGASRRGQGSEHIKTARDNSAIPTATRHYHDPNAPLDSDDESDGEQGPPRLPVSHQITLSAHAKTVTCLAVDKAGARFVTGGSDSDLYFWDFAGMTRELRPFRHVEQPLGAYQPAILDRDGRRLTSLMKGDMYIRDMRHTKGHVAACTTGKWHPSDHNVIATASEDGTLRLWDVEVALERGDDTTSLNVNGGQTAVYVMRDARGVKTPCTTAAWAPGGATILAGGRDGSLQLWEVRSKAYQPVVLAARAVPRTESIAVASRPTAVVRAAHAAGEDVSCIRWKSDGLTCATRSTDGTLKLWDIRRFDAPIAVWGELPALHPMTGCDFSPDGTLLSTGTSVKKGLGQPTLDFFSLRTNSKVASLPLDGTGVVPIVWHPRINQILYGNSDSKVYTLYDPSISEKGAMLCSVKAAPKRGVLSYGADAFSQAMHIVTPHALPMFREENEDHRKRRRLDRKDPLKSRKPEQVLAGPSTGGKLSVSYQQALLASMSGGISGLGGTKDKIEMFKNEDPREELLKYAQMAEENPVFVSPAYAINQPVGADPTAGTYPKFAKTVEPEEEHEDSD